MVRKTQVTTESQSTLSVFKQIKETQKSLALTRGAGSASEGACRSMQWPQLSHWARWYGWLSEGLNHTLARCQGSSLKSE